jgi:hypothetical protein
MSPFTGTPIAAAVAVIFSGATPALAQQTDTLPEVKVTNRLTKLAVVVVDRELADASIGVNASSFMQMTPAIPTLTTEPCQRYPHPKTLAWIQRCRQRFAIPSRALQSHPLSRACTSVAHRK